MLALQNLNQVLFNLTQVTSVIPSGSFRVKTKTVKKKSELEVDVVCSESFINALEILQQSENRNVFQSLPNGALHQNAHQWCYPSKLSKKLALSLQRSKGRSDSIRTSSFSRESFVSRNSFEENKNDDFLNLSEFNLIRSKLVHCLLSRKQITTGFTQVRGFKTERNVKAELERNPGLISRIRKGLGSLGLDGKTSDATNLDDLTKKDATLKKLFSDESVSPEEKYRVKLAFAEGYMTASKKPKGTRAMKWFNIIALSITITILYSLLSVFYAGSKYIFQMRLRDQNEVNPEEINVTFDDVRGVDEAKQELQEVVEFLRNPDKFSTLGGKLPKGVLLIGPPGTGKTLLARAVAGEAGVPFFHTAGPEFDEILVGQGARRVRDLFKSAKDKAPCVIFIDEIDSVGSVRSNSVIHPYANQTINQLLSEMDGFHQNQGVIVLGATNRKEALDKALLRPGRFDVEVKVRAPDFNGRKEILDLYLGRILCKNIDVDVLAKGTIGFTGADLENMVNQAALKAAIDGAEVVTMEYLENARDKILMGPERKSAIPDEEVNLITAYHEGGHAIVAYYTEDSHPIHKITIIPRNETLGHTAYMPEKEGYFVTRSQLLAQLDTCLGGRAAEELIFGPNKITTGASNDLKNATSIATQMVKDFGMSEKVGLRTHEPTYSNFIVINELGQTTNDQIDIEIKRLIQESYDRAKNILKKHAKEHKLLAEALLKYETLNADDIKAILNNKNVNEKNATAAS